MQALSTSCDRNQPGVWIETVQKVAVAAVILAAVRDLLNCAVFVCGSAVADGEGRRAYDVSNRV